MAKEKSDWIALLESANKDQADKIPSGFKTGPQWCEHYRIAPSTWRLRVPALEKAKLAERRMFRVQDRAGRLLMVPHWKVTSP